MRIRLTPRQNSFYGMFATSGRNLMEGAGLLKEMLGADLCTVSQHHGALHHVLELTHIAGPGVLHQQPHRVEVARLRGGRR